MHVLNEGLLSTSYKCTFGNNDHFAIRENHSDVIQFCCTCDLINVTCFQNLCPIRNMKKNILKKPSLLCIFNYYAMLAANEVQLLHGVRCGFR